MLIDFHIHIFPDVLAERAIKTLEQRSQIPSETDGTAKDTLNKMDIWGVDKAVCLNIATKPTQQRKINQFMEKVSSSRLIPFGTIHPDSPDAKEELFYIKNAGIKGIKLHPDYQNFYANDKKMFEIYDICSELKIPIIFHSGYDIGLGCPIHCTPLMIKEIATVFPNLTIIAAHFGGHGMWYDSKELLCDNDNVYFDTAFPLKMEKEIAQEVINKKGADKILFASDCPWYSPKSVFEFIDSLDLSAEEKDLIFYKNAKRLLEIKE